MAPGSWWRIPCLMRKVKNTTSVASLWPLGPNSLAKISVRAGRAQNPSAVTATTRAVCENIVLFHKELDWLDLLCNIYFIYFIFCWYICFSPKTFLPCLIKKQQQTKLKWTTQGWQGQNLSMGRGDLQWLAWLQLRVPAEHAGLQITALRLDYRPRWWAVSPCRDPHWCSALSGTSSQRLLTEEVLSRSPGACSVNAKLQY